MQRKFEMLENISQQIEYLNCVYTICNFMVMLA